MAEHAAEGRRLAHSDDNLRLMARVARMYHEQGQTQSRIAETLSISQARVSRLLRSATEIGIVRTTVTLPAGVHTDIEEKLTAAYGRFGLVDAVVVESAARDSDPTRALGAAAAQYLEATLKGGELVGISSWSATLLACVEAMRAARAQTADRVVQIVGGLGDPSVQMQASRLLGLFASCTGAAPIFMPAPGMLGSRDARDSLTADPTVASVMSLWQGLTLALVGIGGIEGSRLLRESGNALSEADRKMLKRNGAVGDVCLRFFDGEGRPIDSSVDDRVMGITHDELLRIPRRVGVAGGAGKHAAIRGAVLGGWVNVLITDLDEAERLIKSAPRG